MLERARKNVRRDLRAKGLLKDEKQQAVKDADAGADVTQTGPANTWKEDTEQVTTLIDFMKNQCDLQGHDVASKQALIYKKIKPKTTVKWNSGERKVFSIKYLIANWEQWRVIMPTLPPLKARKSAP